MQAHTAAAVHRRYAGGCIFVAARRFSLLKCVVQSAGLADEGTGASFQMARLKVSRESDASFDAAFIVVRFCDWLGRPRIRRMALCLASCPRACHPMSLVRFDVVRLLSLVSSKRNAEHLSSEYSSPISNGSFVAYVWQMLSTDRAQRPTARASEDRLKAIFRCRLLRSCCLRSWLLCYDLFFDRTAAILLRRRRISPRATPGYTCFGSLA